MPKKAEVIIWLRRARLSARFRRPFSLVRFFLDEQKEPNEVSSAKPNEHFYIPPQCKHWSVCRNSLNEKDCFACGSAIPGEMLSNKKPLSRLIFVISTSLLNASIGRSVEITKRLFSQPFCLSGKRDSNPRPSAWEADALPLSYSRII